MFPVYPDQPRPLLDLIKYLIVLTDANYVSTPGQMNLCMTSNFVHGLYT
jgi:hypothetical protein